MIGELVRALPRFVSLFLASATRTGKLGCAPAALGCPSNLEECRCQPTKSSCRKVNFFSTAAKRVLGDTNLAPKWHYPSQILRCGAVRNCGPVECHVTRMERLNKSRPLSRLSIAGNDLMVLAGSSTPRDGQFRKVLSKK